MHTSETSTNLNFKSPAFSLQTQNEHSTIESESQPWEGRNVGFLSTLWVGLCKIVQQIFDQCCSWLCCSGSALPDNEAEGLQGKAKIPDATYENSEEPIGQNYEISKSEHLLPKIPTYSPQEKFSAIIAGNLNSNDEHGEGHDNLKTIRLSQRSADCERNFGINKIEDQSTNLSSLNEVEIMSLYYAQKSVLKEKFLNLSNEQVFSIMIKCKDLPLDMLDSPQQTYYFSNLKADHVDQKLYEKLYSSYDYDYNYDENREKFQKLPDEEAAAFMFKFNLSPDYLLSKSQQDYFYSNLKADQVDLKLYLKLYFSYYPDRNREKFQKLPDEEAAAFMFKFNLNPDSLLSKSQQDYFYSNLKTDQVDEKLYEKLYSSYDYKGDRENFQKLPDEESAAFMFKFDLKPDNLLSKSQQDYFYSNLKADQVDKKLYQNLYCSYHDDGIREKFQKLPDEEAAAFMFKFNLSPVSLLSGKQQKYFYSNLKADQVDEELYEELYSSYDYDGNREKFQKLPDEEAAAFVVKFNNRPKNMMSESQKNYFDQLKVIL